MLNYAHYINEIDNDTYITRNVVYSIVVIPVNKGRERVNKFESCIERSGAVDLADLLYRMISCEGCDPIG